MASQRQTFFITLIISRLIINSITISVIMINSIPISVKLLRGGLKHKERSCKMPKNREIITTLMNTMRLHHKIVERYISDLGIHHGQHHLLMELSKKEWNSQKELADALEVSTATVAVSLKKLENGGYIKRAVIPDDNRYNQLEITEKGREVVKESCKIFESIAEMMFKDFTEQEKETLYLFMKRINKNQLEI